MFDKTVRNDTSELEIYRMELINSRNMFGDINLYITNTMNSVSDLLEGDQQDFVYENTFSSISKIQSAISTIDDLARYLSELNQALETYLTLKFREV